MKNRILKICVIFIFIISIFNMITNNIYATNIEIDEKLQIAEETEKKENKITIDNIIDEGNSFLEKGKESPIGETEMKDFSNFIYNFLFAIGMIIAVIIGLIIGIKFMISTVEEKAKIKQTLIPYVIGCMVLFGAFGIWKIVITALENV